MANLRNAIVALAASMTLMAPAYAQQGSDIYLRCSWSGSDGRTGSEVFKIGGGQFSKFFPDQSTWSAMCFASNAQLTSTCSLGDDQFFVRVTSGTGGNKMTEQYVINRRTGAYQFVSTFDVAYTERNGSCALTGPPPVAARRF